jgi:hypothetical protein
VLRIITTAKKSLLEFSQGLDATAKYVQILSRCVGQGIKLLLARSRQVDPKLRELPNEGLEQLLLRWGELAHYCVFRTKNV